MAFTIEALGILDPNKANPNYQTEIRIDLSMFEDIPEKERPYAVCNHLTQGEPQNYYTTDAKGNMKFDFAAIFLDKCIRLGNLEVKIDGKRKQLEKPEDLMNLYGVKAEGGQSLVGMLIANYVGSRLMTESQITEGEAKN